MRAEARCATQRATVLVGADPSAPRGNGRGHLEAGRVPRTRAISFSEFRFREATCQCCVDDRAAVRHRDLVFTDIEGSTRLLQELGDRYAGLLESITEVVHGGSAATTCVVDCKGTRSSSRSRARTMRSRPPGRQRARRTRSRTHGRPHRSAAHRRRRVTSGSTSIAPRASAPPPTAARCCSRRRRAELGTSRARDLGEHRLKDLAAAAAALQLVDDGPAA